MIDAAAAQRLRRGAFRRPRRAVHRLSCDAIPASGPTGAEILRRLGASRRSVPLVRRAGPIDRTVRRSSAARAARALARRVRARASRPRGHRARARRGRAWASRRSCSTSSTSWSTDGAGGRPPRARLRARVGPVQGRRQRDRRAEPPPDASTTKGLTPLAPRNLRALARLFPGSPARAQHRRRVRAHRTTTPRPCDGARSRRFASCSQLARPPPTAGRLRRRRAVGRRRQRRAPPRADASARRPRLLLLMT